MKVCSKCGESKDESEYYFANKKHSNKRVAHCKVCYESKRKIYYEKNKQKILLRNKEWAENNVEKTRAIKKKHQEVHRQEISDRHRKVRELFRDEIKIKKKAYYEKNKESILASMKVHRDNNKESIREGKKRYATASATNEKYLTSLPVTDEPLMKNGYITVKCKMCGQRFSPTNKQVSHRITAIGGARKAGEANFYCSDACKNSCPIFKFMPGRSTDPRSNKATPKDKIMRLRRCRVKELKQLQCDKDGHNHCEKCGDIIDVEVHHTLPVALYGEESVSPASHILLCFRCHMGMPTEC